MRILALSSPYGGCEAAIIADGLQAASGRIGEEIGLAAALPGLAEDLLNRAGRGLDMVAVVVGPGSFTGLRAGISLAAGIGLALGVPVIGVTVSEALADGLPAADGRTLWTAVAARRGRVFIDMGAGFAGYATDALPPARGRVALCGNAANLVAATLAARGADVMLTAARTPMPLHVAAVAVLRHTGGCRRSLPSRYTSTRPKRACRRAACGRHRHDRADQGRPAARHCAVGRSTPARSRKTSAGTNGSSPASFPSRACSA